MSFDNFTTISLSGERVDLSTFSPVCIPTEINSIDQGLGHIYGRFSSEKIFIVRFSGWGAIGQHSADRLQEAQVKVEFRRVGRFQIFPLYVCFSYLDFSPIQVPILTQADCQEKVQGNETIQSSMLCAGGKGSGTNKVI